MLFIFQTLCRFWAWLKGWTYSFDVPEGVKKGIIIVVPHTSNWDFIYAMGGYHLLNFKFRYFAKKQLFWWPLKAILNKTGAIAVDRVKKENWVDIVTRLYEKEDFFLAMAPEGTRRRVEYWRTGFYHIALSAKVPIVMAFLDYKKKLAIIGESITLTGNIEEDFKKFSAYFGQVSPRIEANFNRDIRPNPKLIAADK